MRTVFTTGLLVFILTLVVYVFSLNGIWAVDHATSLLELDYAMWVHHSFALGKAGYYQPNSVDDFEYNGSYYTALAPGTAILALPLAAAGFILDGKFTVFGHATVLTELFVAMMNAAATSLVYLTGRFFFDKRTSVFLAFIYAFGTISWPFATYFFQSDVSTTFCLLSVYFVIRATRKDDGLVRDAAVSGLAVAIAMLVDYIDAVFLPILLFFIVLVLRKEGRRLLGPALAFASTAVLGIAMIGLYDYFAFGTIFIGSEQLYLHASLLGEFSYPLYLGAYLNLFTPYRGLFAYSIVLVVGVLGYLAMLKSDRYRKEAVLLLACFLGIFVPYSMWYDPTGGEGFGPRFLIAAIPFLLLPAGMVIQGADRRTRALVYALYAAGAVMNGVAGLTSAVTPFYSPLTSSFLAWTLPLFLHGGADTWWMRYVGGDWPVPAAVIIGAALAIPALADRVISRRESESASAQGSAAQAGS